MCITVESESHKLVTVKLTIETATSEQEYCITVELQESHKLVTVEGYTKRGNVQGKTPFSIWVR